MYKKIFMPFFANRYEGPVKRVAEVREFWRAEPSELLPATQAAPLSTYNLAEFSLWQTSSQNRFLVGPGRLATAYTDTLRLLANPALLSARAAQLPAGPVQLAAGPVQLPAGPVQLTAGPDLVQLPVEKEPAVQEDRKQQAARANTIMNYFRPSQSQQRQDHSRYVTMLYLSIGKVSLSVNNVIDKMTCPTELRCSIDNSISDIYFHFHFWALGIRIFMKHCI
jgi:hypothetical protein